MVAPFAGQPLQELLDILSGITPAALGLASARKTGPAAAGTGEPAPQVAGGLGTDVFARHSGQVTDSAPEGSGTGLEAAQALLRVQLEAVAWAAVAQLEAAASAATEQAGQRLANGSSGSGSGSLAGVTPEHLLSVWRAADALARAAASGCEGEGRAEEAGRAALGTAKLAGRAAGAVAMALQCEGMLAACPAPTALGLVPALLRALRAAMPEAAAGRADDAGDRRSAGPPPAVVCDAAARCAAKKLLRHAADAAGMLSVEQLAELLHAAAGAAPEPEPQPEPGAWSVDAGWGGSSVGLDPAEEGQQHADGDGGGYAAVGGGYSRQAGVPAAGRVLTAQQLGEVARRAKQLLPAAGASAAAALLGACAAFGWAPPGVVDACVRRLATPSDWRLPPRPRDVVAALEALAALLPSLEPPDVRRLQQPAAAMVTAALQQLCHSSPEQQLSPHVQLQMQMDPAAFASLLSSCAVLSGGRLPREVGAAAQQALLGPRLARCAALVGFSAWAHYGLW